MGIFVNQYAIAKLTYANGQTTGREIIKESPLMTLAQARSAADLANVNNNTTDYVVVNTLAE